MTNKSMPAQRNGSPGAGSGAFLAIQEWWRGGSSCPGWVVRGASRAGAWLGAAAVLLAASAQAQVTAFTYQGRLNDGDKPATGIYDLTFWLYSATTGGSPARGPETHASVPVSSGLFSVTLNFGDKCFDGTPYWLEMAVRTNGESGFTTLSPRRPLSPAPYAIYATTAGEARTVAASNVVGVLSAAQVPLPPANVALLERDQTFTGNNRFSSPVELTNAANQVAGKFTGDGAALTNLTATALVGIAPSAASLTGPLAGDVTGGQGATVVSTVGGLPASGVASGATAANFATPTNVLGAIVRRDPCDSSFAAGTVTGRFVGDGSGLTNLPTAPPYYAAPSGAVLVSLFSPDAALVAGGYRQFMSTAVPSWVNGATVNAPTMRSGQTTVWSGQAMIVWGGTAGGAAYMSSGAMYDPAMDVWSTLSSVGAPTARLGHVAVWADTQMIVWGGKGATGYLGTGARFNPAMQTWLALPASGAPSARMSHVAVWTGSKMVVWGGINLSGLLADGALYDPAVNQWSALNVPGAPEARMDATAVWTGDRMIVWGGTGESGELDTGGELLFTNGLPVQWLATSLSNAPAARIGHTAVWAGDRMIIWGGQSGGTPLNDGGTLCPACNEWKGVSITNAPAPRYDHAVVWTGTEMLIAGGANASGALSTSAGYDPGTQQWRPLSNVGGPLARSLLGAAWSGTEILLFGGNSGSSTVASLQRLSPQPAWYFYRKL